MKRNILGGFAISYLLIAAPLSVANAADIAVRSPPPAPPATYSWTGFYFGGNVGAAAGVPNGTSDFVDTSAAALAPPPTVTFPQPYTTGNWAFLGGVQAGYNLQVNQLWVVGVEGDWDWTRTKYSFCRQTNTVSAACSDNSFGFENIASSTDWLATARARVGATLGGFLLYGTGGAAWGRVETTLSQSCLVAGCGFAAVPLFASASTSTVKVGWVAGLGLEYAINANWSAKVEWLFVDLGSISNSLVTGTGGAAGYQTTSWSRTEEYNQVRVGVNYRFGYAPVVAKD